MSVKACVCGENLDQDTMTGTHGSIHSRYVAIIESYFCSLSTPRYVFGKEILGRAVSGLRFAKSLAFSLEDTGKICQY